jgi:hypothetical protein
VLEANVAIGCIEKQPVITLVVSRILVSFMLPLF